MATDNLPLPQEDPCSMLPDWVSPFVDDPEYSLYAVMGRYRNSVKWATDLDFSDQLWTGGPNGVGSSLEKVWLLEHPYSVHQMEMGDYYCVKHRVDALLMSPQEVVKRVKLDLPLDVTVPHYVLVFMTTSLRRAISVARICNAKDAVGVAVDRAELYHLPYHGSRYPDSGTC